MPTPAELKPISKLRRVLLASLGVVFVVLGGIGVILPGMPTTVFIIMACWCFTRSCPWLEDKLIRNRFFGPCLMYVDHPEKVSWKARIISILMMWTAISISSYFLILKNTSIFIPATIIACGFIGTYYICHVGKSSRPPEVVEVVAENQTSTESS